MTKHHLSYLMNTKERRNYETLYKHIGEPLKYKLIVLKKINFKTIFSLAEDCLRMKKK